MVGCGPPPVCDQSCGAVCGCCGCAPNDFTLVNGDAYQCDGSCFSPATYKINDVATDGYRLAITKKDTLRNLCFIVVLGPSSIAGVHIVTPDALAVEAAYKTSKLEDCDSNLPTPSPGSVQAKDGTGHVLFVRDSSGACVLDLDATLHFDGPPAVTETLRSAPIPSFACP